MLQTGNKGWITRGRSLLSTGYPQLWITYPRGRSSNQVKKDRYFF